ncbi:MAG: hypothetical protein AB7E79_16460 [Rhodospirillaceae bacterium]
MWRGCARALVIATGLCLAGGPLAAADDPKVLPKAEFKAVAIEALKSANGLSEEKAAQRFDEIMSAARTYPGKSNLAKKVRTGYGHYEKSNNIRKKHAAQILQIFTTAKVAEISQAEAEAVLGAWPRG